MIKFLIPFIFLTANVFAALPPASSKGSGEASYSTTFKTNYGSIPVTRSGTTVTLGTPPLATTVTTIPTLSGEVTNTGNAVTLDNSSVLGKVLTGFTSGAGTVAGSDSILQAIQKLNGNDALDKTVLTKAQDGAAVSTSQIQTPYNQLTTTAAGERLIETGNVNVLSDPGAEAATTPWSAYKDAAGVLPVDGTAGTALYVTCANSATAPLAGTKSFLMTKISASNAQGEGCSIPFTIPTSSTYKVNRLSFDYAIASGTYADDEIEWFVYDVTNGGAPKPFTPSKLKNHSLPSETFAPNGEFQASDSTSYRLIAHVASSSAANAWALKFDNFKLGVFEKTYGSAVTDWVSYTPTVVGFGTTPTVTGKWRKVGDSAQVSAQVRVTNITGASSFTIQIPTGLSIDYSKVTENSYPRLGMATVSNTATGASYTGMVIAQNASLNTVTLYGDSGAVQWSSTVPVAISTSMVYDILITVPIAGWSSSQIMSNDADTRVVNFVGYVASNQALTANVTDLPLTTLKDSHSAWTGSTYVVKVPGDYVASNMLFTTSGSANFDVYVNGTISKYLSYITTTGASGYVTIPNLKTGDAISFRLESSLTILGDASTSVSITRISGPSQIAASDSVSALYTGAPPTGTLSAAINNVTFGTLVKDSHNAYKTSTGGGYTAGDYVVPVNGTYSIVAQTQQTSTYSSVSQSANTYIFIDGVQVITSENAARVAGISQRLTTTVEALSIPLLTGQKVTIKSYNDGPTPTFSSTPSGNFFSIVRTGNY